MALDELAKVHQAPELLGRRRDTYRHYSIPGFGRRQEVADGANTADARSDAGHFRERPSFAEFFEAPELDDVKLGVQNVAFIVEEDADFCVALDAGHRVDEDAFCHSAK